MFNGILGNPVKRRLIRTRAGTKGRDKKIEIHVCDTVVTKIPEKRWSRRELKRKGYKFWKSAKKKKCENCSQ